jgi:hypothetical protein
VPIPSVRAAPRLSLIDQPDPFCTSTTPVVESGTHRQARCSGRARCGAWGRSSCTGCSGWPHFPRLLECLRSPTLPRPGWLRCPARRRHHSALPRPAVVGVGDFLAPLSSSSCTSPPCYHRHRGLPRSLVVVIILYFPALLSSASGTSSVVVVIILHFPALSSSASGTSSVVVVIILHFPALSSSASASYCAECHSLLLSATPSAPSPQSGFTDNEVWRGPFARRLSPWTGRTVLDAPTTRRSCRP